ncbi:uncharacterized protein LOC117625334 [Prunus dulcis]|uniref:uncharacterized protein LOC117625334 n=1 Tax=Prunus dulcis TaxID=3755 RepID=UPI0014835ED7|nr:uncharacterized protein LOC117625334 [Prunus dulcis]
MCLLFPSTLSGAALNWFYRLNPRTINSFDSLKQTLLDHFMIQIDHLYSADDLHMLRQGEDEPLRELPSTPRPSISTPSVAQPISHESPSTTLHRPQASASTPTKSNHYSPAPDSQGGQNPKRKDGYSRGFSERGRHSNHHPSSGGNLPKTHDRAQLPFEPKPRFEVFTTLNTTYKSVLVNEALIIPKPPPRRPTNKPIPNTGIFCRFHQFNGHNTESCIALRNIIEGLICKGKLDKYVHNPPPSPNPYQSQINMISTISDGPTLVGTSNNSLKRYVRSSYAHQVFSTEHRRMPNASRSGPSPITFSEEEERGIIYPHDDPLIIQADISNFDVGRIVVDTGSSVSVMLAEAFNELQVPNHLLDRSITPL